MTEELTFDFLADELAGKFARVGNLGVKLRFVFEGMGVVHIDATKDVPTTSTNPELPADFSVTAPYTVWLDMRAKRLAPHTAAMTRKVRVEGDLLRGMKLIPRVITVL